MLLFNICNPLKYLYKCTQTAQFCQPKYKVDLCGFLCYTKPMNAEHSKNTHNFTESVQAHSKSDKALVCEDMSEQTTQSEVQQVKKKKRKHTKRARKTPTTFDPKIHKKTGSGYHMKKGAPEGDLSGAQLKHIFNKGI